MNNRCFVMTSILSLAGLTALSACGGAPPPPPPPAPAPPPRVVAVPVTGVAPLLPNGVANGRPANLHPGQNEAMWIFHEGNGSWHVRTTTPGKDGHKFQGRVKPAQGAIFADLKPTRPDWVSQIRLDPNNVVSFMFVTTGGEDGFDFSVTNNKCVEFDVEIDGQPALPGHLLLGVNQFDPKMPHFIVCP
jgi:hypothetical protein